MKTVLLAIAVFFLTQAEAQRISPLKNIVFEGAGIRGIAYCGVIKSLQENNLIDSLQRIGGTSAGAILAMMLTLNYSSAEIEHIISNTSFSSFNDGKFGIIGGFARLKRFYGWYRGRKIEKLISNLIEEKTGDAHMTFNQLHEHGFKDLYITGTNLTQQKVVVFSRENYPEMEIRDAIRISMSIPLYFQAVFLEGSRVQRRPGDKSEVYVDGGFVANFPIRIFDSTRYVNTADTNAFGVNKETIGFRIDSGSQIENDKQQKGLAPQQIRNIREYITAFYTIVLENLNRQTLTVQDWKRTVSIDDGNLGPRIKKLTRAETKRLVLNGYSATQQFLKNYAE